MSSTAFKALLRVKLFTLLATICLAIDIVGYTHFASYGHFFHILTGWTDDQLYFVKLLTIAGSVSVPTVAFLIMAEPDGDPAFRTQLAKLSFRQRLCFAVTIIGASAAALAATILVAMPLLAAGFSICSYVYTACTSISWTMIFAVMALVAVPLGYRCVTKSVEKFETTPPPADAA